MTCRLGRFLILPALLIGFVALACRPAPEKAPGGAPADATAGGDRTVYLGGGLGEEELLTFSTTLAASGRPGVLLLDSPAATPYLKAFLEAFRPEQVVPVGTFAEGISELERRLC